MRKPVIALDGYSSTGKSSISKIIAKELGLVHMDTGALYRGITYFAIQNCLDENGDINFPLLFEKLPNINLAFKKVGDELVMFLNDVDISKEIRQKDISSKVSLIACQKEIRDFLLQTQRSIADEGGVILDGRDIGTVVLPDADFKFFVTASIEERTRRRFMELKSLGIEMSEEEVDHNLKTRDKIDSEREFAPLKQAKDAILIDNTSLTKLQTVELILSIINTPLT